MSKPDWIQYGVPTLDRPFGLELWPIFERAFIAIKGYNPRDFRFVAGETPMASLKETVTMLITYYIVVLGGRELMRGREPFKLSFFFKVHNFYLTVISGVLLLLFIEQLLPELVRNGVFHAICAYEGGWTDKLVVLYYVSLHANRSKRLSSFTDKLQLNYLTKYLELIDTCFLFLKKKPLSKDHHAIVCLDHGN